MIKERFYGADSEFLAWVRRQKEELPSKGADIGIAVTDNDCIIHRYKTSVDGLGTREIQCMLDLEVKTRGAMPDSAQLDTLWKRDRWRGKERFGNQVVIHFGRYVLSMSGTDPDNSDELRWCRFARRGNEHHNSAKLYIRSVTSAQLLQILRFDLHPDYLTRRPLRRHHKTSVVYETRRTALGFTVDRAITRRS